MKLKMKYAAGMRDELEEVLGCPVGVVEDREAKYPCKMEYARNYGRDRHVVRGFQGVARAPGLAA